MAGGLAKWLITLAVLPDTLQHQRGSSQLSIAPVLEALTSFSDPLRQLGIHIVYVHLGSHTHREIIFKKTNFLDCTLGKQRKKIRSLRLV